MKRFLFFLLLFAFQNTVTNAQNNATRDSTNVDNTKAGTQKRDSTKINLPPVDTTKNKPPRTDSTTTGNTGNESARSTNANSIKYEISFANTTVDTVHRSQKSENLWSVGLSASGEVEDTSKGYIVDVTVDKEKTTIPPSDYEILGKVSGITINDIKEGGNPIRVIIKKEGENYRQAKTLRLVLDLTVKTKKGTADDAKNNKGKTTETELFILTSDEPLYTYKYLGYLGTNFDLVDGIQARNLFFATNIFIPETRRWGINLSIYGNRAMTKTDTSKQTSFESRIERITIDSIARYHDTATKVTTRVSDNIGANFTPLIHIAALDDGDLSFYYAPQFEFIWRRNIVKNEFLNNKTTNIDTVRNRFPASTSFPLIAQTSTELNYNTYDVYIGLIGLLLRYETEDISIRVSSSIGLNFNYVPAGVISSNSNAAGSPTPVNQVYEKQKRYFYFGRLWITEPTTGLTLGAEMSNYFGSMELPNGEKVSKAQPFYNVTLSKAFNLKNLAALVKPLTSR